MWISESESFQLAVRLDYEGFRLVRVQNHDCYKNNKLYITINITTIKYFKELKTGNQICESFFFILVR